MRDSWDVMDFGSCWGWGAGPFWSLPWPTSVLHERPKWSQTLLMNQKCPQTGRGQIKTAVHNSGSTAAVSHSPAGSALQALQGLLFGDLGV